jgi:cytochrome c oxidase assembly protein subunit 15
MHGQSEDVSHLSADQPSGSPVIAVAVAAAVAMWAVGYVTHLPIAPMPRPITFGGFILCIIAQGFVLGRWSGVGLMRAAGSALITVLINLMVLGALVAEPQSMPSPALWLPGYAMISMVLVGLGHLAGRMIGQPRRRPAVNWTSLFAWVTVAATGLLIIAGGLVTGYDGGLAVPDWPTSFEANMFLLPLSRMTGSAVYYEHAHRLFGSLVGLCTIGLAVYLWWGDRRRWLMWLLVVAVVAVVVQGVMGGLRVTMAHTGTDGVLIAGPEHETLPSTVLRVVHGVFGQVFLGLLTIIALATTRTWQQARRLDAAGAWVDRKLGLIALAALLVQLTLGAILRHTETMLMMHISFAVLALGLVVASGVRAWGLYEQVSTLRRLGLTVIFTALAQTALGIAALVAISLDAERYLTINAMITTLHQAVGAVLLAMVVALNGWVWRLLNPVELPIDEPDQPLASPVASGS